MSPTDRCLHCGKLTGWGLMALDKEGMPTIPLCRSCCHCDKCNRPFAASELQDVPHYLPPEGDRDDEVHLYCEGCRAGFGFME